MGDVGRYLLSVIAVSIICAVATNLIDKSSAHYPVVRLLTGVFLSITVLSPLTSIHISDISAYFEAIEQDGEFYSGQGIQAASELTSSSITDQLQTYILDKASSLGADVHAEVILRDDSVYSISTVSISGNISPYVKTRLQQTLCDELGLSEEQLIWN